MWIVQFPIFPSQASDGPTSRSLKTIFLSFPFIFILDYNLFFLALGNSHYGKTSDLKNKSVNAVLVLPTYLACTDHDLNVHGNFVANPPMGSPVHSSFPGQRNPINPVCLDWGHIQRLMQGLFQDLSLLPRKTHPASDPDPD